MTFVGCEVKCHILTDLYLLFPLLLGTLLMQKKTLESNSSPTRFQTSTLRRHKTAIRRLNYCIFTGPCCIDLHTNEEERGKHEVVRLKCRPLWSCVAITELLPLQRDDWSHSLMGQDYAYRRWTREIFICLQCALSPPEAGKSLTTGL